MLRRIIVSLILSFVLIFIGAFVAYKLIQTKPTPPSSESVPAPLSVRAIRATPQSFHEPIDGFGTAQADREARVAAEVSGEVIELAENLRVGTEFKGGDLLLKVDPREYTATRDKMREELTTAKAALNQLDVEETNIAQLIKIAEDELVVAERELERVRNLFEDSNSNPRELDQARLAYQAARRTLQTYYNQRDLLPTRKAAQEALCAQRAAELEIAELNLERCTITAPFDGQLREVRVELGERVTPGLELLMITDPRHIDIPIELAVSTRPLVRSGAPVQLELESRQEERWTGRVARISPAANELNRTYSLFVEYENNDENDPLIPGMFVRATIQGPLHENVIIVPRGCVEEETVYVCRDGRARTNPVTIERIIVDQAVVSGIAPGSIVLTSNLDAIYDGAPVEPLLADTIARAPTSQPSAAAATPESP